MISPGVISPDSTSSFTVFWPPYSLISAFCLISATTSSPHLILLCAAPGGWQLSTPSFAPTIPAFLSAHVGSILQLTFDCFPFWKFSRASSYEVVLNLFCPGFALLFLIVPLWYSHVKPFASDSFTRLFTFSQKLKIACPSWLVPPLPYLFSSSALNLFVHSVSISTYP